ncbi:MAG: DUF5666 domain-containing protein [Pseudomonadales bacterium]|nr:DUF5666 domain-containing protein [Pseudomonadales bacterium]
MSVDRSGLSVGTITGFGSIIVNGVRYETGSATILDDDDAIDEASLAVGDYVVVEGTLDEDGTTGVATRVLYDAEVEGPISAIDVDAGTFVVLGRTVIVDRATVFEDDDFAPPSIEGLMVGDRVEVSGLLAEGGAVLATRIEESDDTDFEVKGFVSNLDSGAATFDIGSQTVDYGSAVLEDFDGEALADGQFVEVRADTLDGDVLQATLVELEDDLPFLDRDDDDDDDREFDFEGVITAVDGDIVTVGSVDLRIAEDADFEDGSREDLVVGARAEFEGDISAEGELIADEVDFDEEVDSEFEGLVDAIDLENGTFTLLGITVTITASTQFEDDSDLDLRTFSLADLVVGDFVEVRGVLVDGTLEAARVERDDDEDDSDDSADDDAPIEVEGPLDALSMASITVNGVVFAIDAETDFELDDEEVDFETFAASVEIGDEVDVDGTILEDGSFLADDIDADSTD